MSDSPEETTVDTTEPAEEDLYAGIDLTANYGNGPLQETPGQPEQTEAVETSPEEAVPEETVETEESTETEETPEPEQTVNFDGFSDDQKSLFERLLKEGHVTPEEIEHERTNTMFHAAFTRARMKDAEKVKEIEARYAGADEDLKLIEQIRSDDRLHAAWMKLSQEGVEAEDADELVDKRSAEQIAQDAVAKALAQKDEQAALVQRSRAEKEASISEMLAETKSTLGIDDEMMVRYLQVEEAKLPPGTDAVETIAPEEWQRRLVERHRVVSLEATVSELKQQLSKKTANDERTAKQSMPPPASVSSTQNLSLYEQTCADLGIDPVNPSVTGLGHMGRR